jgi:hypothetical protein
LESVVAVLTPPANVPLAPVAGTVNVTTTPLVGDPFVVTVATIGSPNAPLMEWLCDMPLVAVITGGKLSLIAFRLLVPEPQLIAPMRQPTSITRQALRFIEFLPSVSSGGRRGREPAVGQGFRVHYELHKLSRPLLQCEPKQLLSL